MSSFVPVKNVCSNLKPPKCVHGSNTYSSTRVMIRAQACLFSFLPVCLPDVVRFHWLVYDSVRINSWKDVRFEKFEDTHATTTDNDDGVMMKRTTATAINDVQQERTRTVMRTRRRKNKKCNQESEPKQMRAPRDILSEDVKNRFRATQQRSRRAVEDEPKPKTRAKYSTSLLRTTSYFFDR